MNEVSNRQFGAETLTYAVRDAALLPLYRSCVSIFRRTHPQLAVTLLTAPTGQNYSDWLDAKLASAEPPDAFSVAAPKFAALLDGNELASLDELLPRAGLAKHEYWPGLARLWLGPDGHRYALPTSIETSALAVHRSLVVAAHVPWSAVGDASWGTSLQDAAKFEETLWRLTIDASGKRASHLPFARRETRTYGLVLGSSYADGFDSWVGAIHSAGDTVVDQNPWPRRFTYGDSSLSSFLAFWRREIVHGYMPPTGPSSPNPAAMFNAKRAVIATVSSSEAVELSRRSRDAQFVRFPAGEDGRQWTPLRPLTADAVSAKSPDRVEASHLISLFGSGSCAEALAERQRDLPASPHGAARWLSSRTVKPSLAAFVPRSTSVLPTIVVAHREEIERSATDAMTRILRGADPAKGLAALDASLPASRR